MHTFMIASVLTKVEGEKTGMNVCDALSLIKFREKHKIPSKSSTSNCDVRLPDYKNDK